MACQHTDTDLGMAVDIAFSHRIAVKVMHQHDIAIVKAADYICDLVVVDPGATGLDRASFSLFQRYDCMFHYSTS